MNYTMRAACHGRRARRKEERQNDRTRYKWRQASLVIAIRALSGRAIEGHQGETPRQMACASRTRRKPEALEDSQKPRRIATRSCGMPLRPAERVMKDHKAVRVPAFIRWKRDCWISEAANRFPALAPCLHNGCVPQGERFLVAAFLLCEDVNGVSAH
jgi:hypothetical protein